MLLVNNQEREQQNCARHQFSSKRTKYQDSVYLVPPPDNRPVFEKRMIELLFIKTNTVKLVFSVEVYVCEDHLHGVILDECPVNI